VIGSGGVSHRAGTAEMRRNGRDRNDGDLHPLTDLASSEVAT
jgi:hypothetical protein